jgi:hypothetical protein
MGQDSLDVPRFIEIGDSAPDMPHQPHTVIIHFSPTQNMELYLSTAELHDLVNKGVQRLYEIGDLEWV